MFASCKRLGAAVACVALVAVAGCGSGQKMNPVTGTVKFADGSPLTVGQITFSSGTSSASGAINSDGSFELSSLEPGDGAPAGKYKVTIFASESGEGYSESAEGSDSAAGEASSSAGPKPLVHTKYTSSGMTDIELEVKPGKNHFDVQVEPFEG